MEKLEDLKRNRESEGEHLKTATLYSAFYLCSLYDSSAAWRDFYFTSSLQNLISIVIHHHRASLICMTMLCLRCCVNSISPCPVFEGFTYNEDGETIISEEEFLEIKNLKTFKQNYRMHHEDLKALKAEIQYCQKLTDQCRHKLVKGRIFPCSYLTS